MPWLARSSAWASFATLLRVRGQHATAPVPDGFSRGVMEGGRFFMVRARAVIERHIKVRGDANPYQPENIEYFEKRRSFAWRTYPVGKPRAFRAGKDKLAAQHATHRKPDCRITSAERDLRKARAV